LILSLSIFPTGFYGLYVTKTDIFYYFFSRE